MKAIVYKEYGNVDVLHLADVKKPTPKENQVLIKIQTAAVNDWEVGLFTGKPYFMRLFLGWRRPKPFVQIPGCDVAGRIEAVGSAVETLQIGDEVYGDLCESGFGSFAEYVCAPENSLALKTTNMSFEQAAAIPQAAMLALQGLHDKAPIQDGQQILINGAGGGVGTFGIQIAKLKDIEVTGVDSPAKLDLMLSLGFDHVIDYEQEDFTKSGKAYDLILDQKMNRSPFAYARALKPGGAYIATGGSTIRIVQMLCVAWWIKLTQKKLVAIVGLKANRDLNYLGELFEDGKLKPILDGPYKLADAVEAMKYFLSAKHKGKIIITMD